MKVSVCTLLLAVCLLRASGEPAFEKQTYNIYDVNGQVCASFQMAAQLRPEYKRNNTDTPVTREVNLPGLNETDWDVKLDASRCPVFGVTELVIEFGNQNSFTLITMSNDTTSPEMAANANWTVSFIQFQYNKADSNVFPDTVDTGIVKVSVTSPGIGTDNSQGGLFKCNSPSTYTLVDADTRVDMELKDVLLNPYNDPDGETPSECAADHEESSSDDKIVPIAVGCALGGLLLIVLIVFLIGRRSRRGRTGYKQV